MTNNYYANGYPGIIALYDLDNSTGKITNELILDDASSPYGIEFSPNSQVLYANTDYHDFSDPLMVSWLLGELVQYDLTAPSIKSSKHVLKEYSNYSPSLFVARGALQLAIDGRIYLSRSGGRFLERINKPNAIGSLAHFEAEAVFFGGYKLTTYGLPPFLSSYFVTKINVNGEISGNDLCLGSAIDFSVDMDDREIVSLEWDFGDGTSSVLIRPSHMYLKPGTYLVNVKVITSSETFTAKRTLNVFEIPTIANQELTECDYDQDGKAIFDLKTWRDDLKTKDKLKSVQVFLTPNDAKNNVNPLPDFYENKTNDQVLYIRVSDVVQCFSIATLHLKTVSIIPKKRAKEQVCSSTKNYEVDLTVYAEKIKSNSTEVIQSIRFYTDLKDLEKKQNDKRSIQIANYASATKIFARIEIVGQACAQTVMFDIELLASPVVKVADTKMCENDHVTIQSDLFTSYRWDGLKGDDVNQPNNASSVTIKNPGTYRLTATNTSGCSGTTSFTVSHYELIAIRSVQIDNGNSVTIEATGQTLEYSLDRITWQKSKTFSNLPIGDYTVYIRDMNGCTTQTAQFTMFYITNFISPNNDGKNDFWKVAGLELIESIDVEIYDRYGKTIHKKMTHYDNVLWDGKSKGSLADASYWYTLDFKNGKRYSGSILLKNK